MARTLNRLTARAVAALKEPGWHADGGGLYLRVDDAGSRRWVFVFHVAGRRREMGLGSAALTDLKDARRLGADARAAVQAGRDPIAERRAAEAGPVTFATVCDELLADLQGGWKNEKHRKQWRASLTLHAGTLLSRPVADVGTADVLKVLQPIWTKVPITASRVRGRIERVLDAAKARGLRQGENPARWRGHLQVLLSAPPKLARGHHPALPFPELPAFLATLRARPSLASSALQFTILTAARSGETLGAAWSEISDDVWTVPAHRMKGGREHRVPLSAAALAVLRDVRPFVREGGFVFPGLKVGRPLSIMAMEMMLRRIGRDDVTVHGFRSTFRDWAGDRTQHQREVVEAALAHAVGDATERAYRRSDALEKRRALMDDWARFCAQEPAQIVQFRR